MPEKLHIQMPEAVTSIIHTLQEAGYEAYAVGGCVRDIILGRLPDDWDITTSAKPEEVKKLFRRTVDTGIQHGTVTVMVNKTGYEVTTYRIDGTYEDGRHPKDVMFTPLLTEDLRRRDFTINAMAYNDEEGLVDIFGGIEDIERKLLRCVGDPKERFGEDALRMMRAVRFSAQLGYDIEEETKAAIRELAPSLQKVSAERIAVELVKLLVSAYPERLRVCYETGLTAVFFPEFDRMMETTQNNPHHCYSVGEHTLHAMKEVPADKALRLAMLLHDSGKPQTKSTDEKGVDHFYGHAKISGQIAKTVLRRLKFDNDTTDRVVRLVTAHDVLIEPQLKYMRRAINRNGEDLFPDIFAVKQADMLAQSDFDRDKKKQELDELRRIYAEVVERGDCVVLKNLAITGSDLIAQGMKPGKQLGAVLKELLEEVIEDPSKNTREYLLKAAFDREEA